LPRPANQLSIGGISMSTSSVSSRLSPSTSACSNAFMYRSTQARCSASDGSLRGSCLTPASFTRVRARCRELFTDTAVVPRISAASDAEKLSTSRRISAPR